MTAYITGDWPSTVVIVIKMNGWDRRQTLVSFYHLQTERNQSNIECIVLHPNRHVLIRRITVSSRFIWLRHTCTVDVWLNRSWFSEWGRNTRIEYVKKSTWKKVVFFSFQSVNCKRREVWMKWAARARDSQHLCMFILLESEFQAVHRSCCVWDQISLSFFLFFSNSRYGNLICAHSSSSRAVVV